MTQQDKAGLEDQLLYSSGLTDILSKPEHHGLGGRIAQHMGWKQGTVSQIKLGRRRVSRDDAERIARFVGYPVDELFAPKKPEFTRGTPRDHDLTLTELMQLYPEVMELPPVLTVKQVAAATGCTLSYIRNQILSGTLSRLPIANQHLIPRHAVLRFMAGQEQEH